MTLAPSTHTEGLRPPDQGPQEVVRPTRPRLKLWDRIKFILLLGGAWFVLVWTAMATDPILPFQDAMRLETSESAWVLVLLGAEILRQLHFLVSERSAGYHGFWANSVFGATERYVQRRFTDWTRFKIARALKWTFIVVLAVLVLGKLMKTNPFVAVTQLPAVIWTALPFVGQVVFVLGIGILQFVGIFWFMSRGGVETYYPDDIKTRFTDVWGQDNVVARVKENIVFLERPHEIEDRGGYVPGGILLWGPPGTGKTLMAEAVAGETGKPYVFVDPGAFINMFFGIGILKVKGLFRKLRKLALRYGGVIVFFDEADSLGSRGSLASGGTFPRGMSPLPQPAGCNGFSYLSPETQWSINRANQPAQPDPPIASRWKVVMPAGMNGGMGGGGMGTLQALLTELSGLKKPRGFINRFVRRALGMRPKPPPKYRILVMMATNLPEALDEALLRPGRIDRIYKVGYPSKAGRIRTYEGYFNKVRHQLTAEDMDRLATVTPYATGATIKDLVNESLITAVRDGREVISWKDVLKAKQLKELGPPEDVEYIERERHAVAVHEACHAVIAYRTRRHLDIDIATIEKGSDYLGMVKPIPPEDQFTRWRSEYTSDIYVSLASLAGERMFFEDDSSSGVSSDLESATMVATLMEGTWGMGSTISSAATAGRFDTGTPGGGLPGGNGGREAVQAIRGRLADRIEDNLAHLLEETRQLLITHRRDVLVLAHALESHKTLTGDDIAAILDGHVGPVVDGRPYQNDDFFRDIEAYHRAAVIAHINHTSTGLRLPAVPGAAVVDADPEWVWAGPHAPHQAAPSGAEGSVQSNGATGTTDGVVVTDGFAAPGFGTFNPTEVPGPNGGPGPAASGPGPLPGGPGPAAGGPGPVAPVDEA
jgi:cell division protease FtsH